MKDKNKEQLPTIEELEALLDKKTEEVKKNFELMKKDPRYKKQLESLR